MATLGEELEELAASCRQLRDVLIRELRLEQIAAWISARLPHGWR